MKKINQVLCCVALSIFFNFAGKAQDIRVRERINFDKGWLFALGHSFDASKDFDNGTGYFSYFAKAGYGDGAASASFDDRAWRVLDLPHDWCVELPFSEKGGHSHGYKAIGRNFPENSVGWYRKKFSIPESDLGKRISIEFDGVHRDAIVWVNGFYLGTEHNGYASYAYDITDYLNYGGENVVAVRIDATMEEGWYYEGAGIYRHTWLTKTSPLHVARYGTFVTTELSNNNTLAKVVVRTTIVNKAREEQTFTLEDMIVDAENKAIAAGSKTSLKLKPGSSKCFYSTYTLKNPNLWSLEKPYLHKLLTIVRTSNKVVDTYETNFGVRTVRFDANEGFFLNGKNVKIVGTNCHQDHAGVGTAIPDGLQEYRIKRLKDMGNNGIRTSHNPPTPEMLDACDRLGMLVLDENRLMGSNDEHFKYLKNMMLRDRNHPSVVLWSLGNEEWAIEGNIKGARIAATMQAYAQQLDSSRAFTAALSGGWDGGIGTVTQVMGYNYIVQGNIDEHHKKFPWQAGIGTEESNTVGTRGIYETNDVQCHLAPTNRMPENVGTESGWQFYAARPFLAGLFYWTGFDYRGEPTPYGWPAIASQFGIIDLCGYPKDIFYYLKAWWGKDPVLHIWPHWNWKGKEGQPVKVTVYSNCDAVELFLNNKSLGKQTMQVNSHLEWTVNYEPGILSAKGFKGGKETLQSQVETTDVEDAMLLTTDKTDISFNSDDVSVITVNVTDKNGLVVPTAMNEVAFAIEGEGKIIGVGNGDPSSHEKDKYTETIRLSKIADLKEFPVASLDNCPQVSPDVDASDWKAAFTTQSKDWKVYTDSLIVVRGTFEISEFTNQTQINLFTKSIVENQSVYVNGKLIKANIKRDAEGQSFVLDHSILKPGKNVFAVTGQRFRKKYQWDEPNTDPGLVQVIIPAEQWKRRFFNGYAQVIVQPTGKTGNIKVTATAAGLKPASLTINVK